MEETITVTKYYSLKDLGGGYKHYGNFLKVDAKVAGQMDQIKDGIDLSREWEAEKYKGNVIRQVRFAEMRGSQVRSVRSGGELLSPIEVTYVEIAKLIREWNND